MSVYIYCISKKTTTPFNSVQFQVSWLTCDNVWSVTLSGAWQQFCLHTIPDTIGDLYGYWIFTRISGKVYAALITSAVVATAMHSTSGHSHVSEWRGMKVTRKWHGGQISVASQLWPLLKPWLLLYYTILLLVSDWLTALTGASHVKVWHHCHVHRLLPQYPEWI